MAHQTNEVSEVRTPDIPKQGGDHGNQFTKVANGQNARLVNQAENLGRQYGVNESTIRHDGTFVPSWAINL